MKLITAFCISLVLCGCQDKIQSSSLPEEAIEVIKVPEIDLFLHEVVFNRNNSTWYHKDDSSLVSGFVKEYFVDGTLFRQIGLVQGKKQGKQLTFFPDGRLRFEETYRDNKLHGTVRRWSLESGYQLTALLHYRSGKPHGEQKKWYQSGELHKRLHLKDGREEGLQQAFRRNGALYANYEAKNGRVFGLKRANLCYELDNEQIVFNQ